MRNEGCITSIDNLKNWFYLNQKQGNPSPYFSVYRGPAQNPGSIIFRNEKESDVDASWQLLEEMMEMHIGQGGLFRIYITDKPKHNVGLSTIFKVNNPYTAQQGMQGVGVNNFGIYGSLAEMVNAEIAKERALWDMQQQIEALKAEQQASVGEMEEFMPIIKDLAHKFGMKMMGYGPPSGSTTAPPMPPPMGAHTTDTPGPEGYDYDRVEPALDSLREVFPDMEGTLEKLAQWARTNPETAKQIIQNLPS
jgi:hypothetical protein